MRVARLYGSGDLRIVDEPVPVPAAGESLVRVTAVGICGSDLHWYVEGGIGDAQLTRPLVVGHEFAGVIAGGPRAGQRVAVDPAIPCGRCEPCLDGDRNLCLNTAFAGYSTQDGALREFLTWPTELLHPLPENLSDADGAMLEPLGVALHAIDLGHVEVGATVAVIGCGPIGLCLVQLARVAGATTVLAVDPRPHRSDAAARLGADVVLPTDPAQFPAALAEATGGRGVDVAIEAAGSDAAVDLAVTAARPGARVVLAGIPDDDRTTFRASSARRKGLALIMVRRMQESVYPRGIRLLEQGRVDVASLVSDRFPLSRADQALRTAHTRAGLKVLIEPDAADAPDDVLGVWGEVLR
jgi:L-iditol 2-dehydrogenase